MPKPAAHALTWCPDTSSYTARDPEHDGTLAAILGGETLTLLPESQEWFAWLASIPSFAFVGRAGRFTARCETKQRGERYWVAYQHVEGKLLKRYLGKTSDLTATKLEDTARWISSARPALPTCTDAPATLLPAPASAPYVFPEWVMAIDIGQASKGPPYDDTFWLPDRCHFPLVRPTKERCPIHPTARWLQRDPANQAWCTHPTCWRRSSLMRLGALVQYHFCLDVTEAIHSLRQGLNHGQSMRSRKTTHTSSSHSGRPFSTARISTSICPTCRRRHAFTPHSTMPGDSVPSSIMY